MNALLSIALFLNVGAESQRSAQDLVVLGDSRPVLLRLHVEIDGQPADRVWRNYLQKWVDYLDRDGDGRLNATELANLPKSNFFAQFLRGGILFPGQGSALTPQDLGLEAASKAGADELFAYYSKGGISGLNVSYGSAVLGTGNSPSEVLFKTIDRDQDGFLSKQEIESAVVSLRRLDSDDDETVSSAELTFNANPTFGAQPVPARMVLPGQGPGSTIFAIPRYGNRVQFTALLLAQYDRNRDGKLSREEIGLDKASFAKLDRDFDEVLNAEELERLPEVAPRTRVRVQVGRVSAIQLLQGGPLSRDPKSGRINFSASALPLQGEDVQLSVHLGPGMQTIRFGSTQYYLQLLRSISKGKDFVRAEDLNTPQGRVLKGILAAADTNQDGILSEKEVQRFGDLVSEAQLQMASLHIAEEGRSLFQLLDVNRDGRLSRRELLSAWERLGSLDCNRDGKISRGEIARQFSLAIARGPNQPSGFVQPVQPGMAEVPRGPVTGRGPIWFQKMDANGDGEVSQLEFLGPRELFDQIDANRDGLIDLEEAFRADQKFRPPQARQP